MREEQDCDALAAQAASLVGYQLMAFPHTHPGRTNPDDMPGYLVRERMPVFACIPGFEICEEFAVERDGILRCRLRRAIERHVIRGRNHKDHPAVLCNPIQLSHPDLWSRFAQQQEQGRILRQSIGKFDVAVSESGGLICDRCFVNRPRLRNPERKDRVTALRLRLERICIKCRCVICNVQLVQPVELVQHERRSKSHRSPLSNIAINANGVPPKLLVRLVEPSVVSKVMDPNLKAILSKFLSQLARILVLSFGNKIE